MTDINAFKNCIDESGMTIVHIANESGILRETLYNRMKTGDFKASEISALTRVLHLTREQRDTIFFADECEFNSTIRQNAL